MPRGARVASNSRRLWPYAGCLNVAAERTRLGTLQQDAILLLKDRDNSIGVGVELAPSPPALVTRPPYRREVWAGRLDHVASETTIDLDRGPAPARPKPQPRWRYAVGLVLSAVVAGATLQSSVPAPGVGLVEVATVEVSTAVDWRVAVDRMFVLMSRGSGPELAAFRLSDGRPLWRTSVAADLGLVAGIQVVGDTVLLGSTQRIEALDAASGRRLWRSDGAMVPAAGEREGVVLTATFLDATGFNPSPSASTTSGPRVVRAINLRTGRPLWSYQVPDGWFVALPDDPPDDDPTDRFVVVDPTGRASTVDLATGAVRTTATIALGSAGQADGKPSGPLLALRGDQLLVGYLRLGHPVVTAYRTDTLTSQWTVTVPTLELSVIRCAPLLCLGGQDETQALAPKSGAVVWVEKDVTWYGLVDHWLYEAAHPFQPDSVRLADPNSGRTVLDLSRWRLSTTAADKPPLLQRDDTASHRTWLGVLTPGLHIQILGAVAGLPQNSCDLGIDYIACSITSHQVRIWRYGS